MTGPRTEWPRSFTPGRPAHKPEKNIPVINRKRRANTPKLIELFANKTYPRGRTSYSSRSLTIHQATPTQHSSRLPSTPSWAQSDKSGPCSQTRAPQAGGCKILLTARKLLFQARRGCGERPRGWRGSDHGGLDRSAAFSHFLRAANFFPKELAGLLIRRPVIDGPIGKIRL